MARGGAAAGAGAGALTRSEFSGYLLFVALAFGILGVVNLLRPRKRWLGTGALFWGVAAMAYREDRSLAWIGFPCALAILCVGMQARERERRGKA